MVLYQVRVDAAVGRVDAARGQLARLHRDLGGWQPPRLLARWLRVTEAEVDLAAGDPAAALGRVPLDRLEDHDSPLVPERLLRARALLDLADPRGAEDVLAPLRTAGLEPAVGGGDVGAHRPGRRSPARGPPRRRGPAPCPGRGRAGGHPPAFRGLGPRSHLPRLLTHAKALHPRTRRFVEQLEAATGPVQARTDGAQPVSLTDRELSVLQYLPSMMTYPEIADQLFVSVNTVKSHLRHLYAKLEVINRRQAVIRARELGLLDQ